MPKKIHPVQLDELRGTPVRGKENTERLEGGYRQIPMDMNAYLSVTRVLDQTVPRDGVAQVMGLVGHILDIEFLNGEKTHIQIKSYRGDGIKVLVNGEEVYKWAKSSQQPSTLASRRPSSSSSTKKTSRYSSSPSATKTVPRKGRTPEQQRKRLTAIRQGQEPPSEEDIEFE